MRSTMNTTAEHPPVINALLVSPKHPYSFWSLPEACALAGVKAPSPPLGLITAAALLPETWRLRVVDMNVGELGEDDWAWADVVFFSSMLHQLAPLSELLKKARELGKPTVVGGPITSSFPEKVRDAGCTYMVVGEAEGIMDQVAEAVETRAPAREFSAQERPDITSTVIPRYDLLDMGKYDALSLQTSRGCPHNCEFCDVIRIYGRRQRFKSPEQVLKELDALKEQGWSGTVFIADDNFIGHPKRAKTLLKQIIDWQLKNDGIFGFFTQTTASLGEDMEMVDLLTAANFGMVFVGIESPSEEVLSTAGKNQNIRVSMADCLRDIMRNGLSITGSFIIGLDGETAGAGKRLCDYAESLNIPVVMLNMIGVPPGTALWRRMEEENRLLPDVFADGMLSTNFVTTRPFEEIKAEYIAAWKQLYEPRTYLKRVYRHCLEIRPTRKAAAKSNNTRETADIVPDPKKKNLKKHNQAVVFARLCWRQGVLRSSRFLFWKQLLGMYRNNPSRLFKYITLLVLGEDMFAFCDYLEKHSGPDA